ncbi:sterol desaturase family protein [Billgrantia gudaonensis]|uniref:Sterol desaturase/sphingolipid hydroxylase, fatty acid hydroxylase superfamily n=1 Tax=Billgrantia gudaonensis TaxID=376427 RepID=A0A1G8XTG1_9GAMM|nr:sterol desaturase family protein [Halomonas gudaonensis]SDJ93746.1 Sterol desaturase/sphingolipid hydroxylase, fatty acid hydroxylase superfamily [Halomonas gudaonensis]
MSETLLTQEPWVRLAVFVSILAAMALWEVVAARRPQRVSRWQRWPSNLLIVVVDTLAVRLIFPLAAVGAALVSADKGWGVFNLIAAPGWLAMLVSVVVLDAAIYFQHRLFHAIPWLWRLHRMHHADLEFDVTTGLRFHPLEILLSMGIKVAVVALLGAPALAVLLFEILLNGTSLFNHGNVRLPAGLDRWLRLVVVTPEMHRVHHSIIRHETDSNFGFNLPWWDRLFGTYRDQPAAGHLGMTIGIEDFRDVRELRLDRMLLQPFRNPVPRTQRRS